MENPMSYQEIKENMLQLRKFLETAAAEEHSVGATPEVSNTVLKNLSAEAATNKEMNGYVTSSTESSNINVDPEVVKLEVDLLQLQERKAWCDRHTKELRERIAQAVKSGLLGAEELARREGIEILKNGVESLGLDEEKEMKEEEDKYDDKEEKEEHKQDDEREKEEHRNDSEEKKDDHNEETKQEQLQNGKIKIDDKARERAFREVAYRKLEEEWQKAKAVAQEKFILRQKSGDKPEARLEFDIAYKAEKDKALEVYYAKKYVDNPRCYFCGYPDVNHPKNCPRKHDRRNL